MSTGQTLTPLGSALAGALGACFSNAVVYPLDTVKTRLQALPLDSPSAASGTGDEGGGHGVKGARGAGRANRWEMLEMLVRIIRTEGLSGTFKGFAANMINTFSMQFAYFFFHSLLRNATLRHLRNAGKPSKLSTPNELLLGAAAGALAQIFTIPVSVIATRQQLWTPSTSRDAKAGQTAPSLLQTGGEIIGKEGLSGLWTGLRPGLVLTANPAITYGVFERMKSAVLSGNRDGTRLGVAESFWIGVGAKAIATIVTYPYIFAKVRLQAGNSGAGSKKVNIEEETYAQAAAQPPSSDSAVVGTGEGAHVEAAGTKFVSLKTSRRRGDGGAIPLLRAVYREKGFAGWYQGLAAQILKAALCQGILFVSKDQFEKWALVIIAALTALRKRLVLA